MATGMKLIVFLFSATIFVGNIGYSVYAEASSKDEVQNAFGRCCIKHDCDKGDDEERNAKYGCTMACVLEKFDIMDKDGFTDGDKYFQFMVTMFEAKDTKGLKILMKACVQEGNESDTEDKCERVDKIRNCMESLNEPA